MILLGIVYGAVTGNMQAVTDAAFASAKDAVTLCITMTGMMALWVGVMEIARGAGLIRKWSEKLKPFIHFLFPGIPKGHKVQEYIAANMIANILGLGSAATPAGLKAMEELAEIKKEKGSITVLVIASFFVIIAVFINLYIIGTNKSNSQEKEIKAIQEAYNVSADRMEEEYQNAK